MDVKDENVLEMLNKLIAANRFNKLQSLHIVKLATISKDYEELKDNMTWENIYLRYKQGLTRWISTFLVYYMKIKSIQRIYNLFANLLNKKYYFNNLNIKE